MQKTDSLGKTLIVGKIEGRRRGRQRMKWLDDITDSMDMIWSKFQGDSEGQRNLEYCSPWDHKELNSSYSATTTTP